jgi:hypothetical protein
LRYNINLIERFNEATLYIIFSSWVAAQNSSVLGCHFVPYF